MNKIKWLYGNSEDRKQIWDIWSIETNNKPMYGNEKEFVSWLCRGVNKWIYQI